VEYISPIKGGEGCVRDVIEQTLRVQENWLKDNAYTW
jgi:3-deoxy-D-manno-octulosonate 8-phosphate phosphatase (KDO 8-P phosphatase)